MNLKEKFKALHPHALYLEEPLPEEIAGWLKDHEWVSEQEAFLRAEKPGEGNMNMVLRIITDQRSFIVKQSRPWVQKYPQVAAPIDRIGKEHQFYQLISGDKILSEYTPTVLAYDDTQFMLATEDLGEAADYTFLYKTGEQLSDSEINTLLLFLSHLHQVGAKDTSVLENQQMKQLNHEHIFVYPYQLENGFDLDSVQQGLQQVSLSYKQDEKLKEKIRQLGEIYLQEGLHLLHGDFYPGSWLKATSGIKVIDPEFAYFGRPEFDLGVMLAHMKMSRQEKAMLEKVGKEYQKPAGFDENLCLAFAGVEVMRRLIGLAQLPLSLSLEEKAQLMQAAKQEIMSI
ncbi:MAG: phosphotransferase [Cyclobacteriaceae bacterium]